MVRCFADPHYQSKFGAAISSNPEVMKVWNDKRKANAEKEPGDAIP